MSVMTVYCYAISPIDFWSGAHTEASMLEAVISGASIQDAALDVAELAALDRMARDGFRMLGWEGDISEGPYYFVLPELGYTSFGVMWKQSNNGDTFVAAQRPLPWLLEGINHSMVTRCKIEDGKP